MDLVKHQRAILYADGRVEPQAAPMTMDRVNGILKNAMPFTVNLRDGRVLLGDDNGHAKGLPINAAATALYRSICRPGTTHVVVGDVIVAPDADFGED